MTEQWKPSADIAILKKRAQVLKTLRAFFDARDVTEVQTPLMSSSAATDVHLDSFTVHGHGAEPYYLLTSPELPIKRLLCAGMDDCYQISSAFRQGEQGARHNPEFTMLEWYRLGFSAFDLMDEVIELIQHLVHALAQASSHPISVTVQKISYQQAFLDALSIDPLNTNAKALNQQLRARGVWGEDQPDLAENDALDLLFDQCIASEFPHNQITAVYHYPASQASLARLCKDDASVSERFEVFWGGMELANGFYELDDAKEQRERFIKDHQTRAQLNKAIPPYDELFLNALESGLPDCSGVALGVDRLVMKLLSKTKIDEVLAFGVGRV